MTESLLPEKHASVALISLTDLKQSTLRRPHPFLPKDFQRRLYVVSFSDGDVKIGMSLKVKIRIQGLSGVRRNLGLASDLVGKVAVSIPHVNILENEQFLLSMYADRKAYGEYVRAPFDEVYAALCSLTFRTEQTQEEKQRGAPFAEVFGAAYRGVQRRMQTL